MAFLVYFFVLVVMAGSVVFGLDAVNAPLHDPGQHAKTEHAAQHKRPAANTSGPARRAQIAAAVGRHQPEPAPQQQARAASVAAPTEHPTEQTPGTVPTPQDKPEVVAEQEPPAAAPPLPPERPQILARMQAKPEADAQQKPEADAQRKPETVAQEQPPAENATAAEHSTVGAATETHKAQAKRSPPHRASAQAPAPAQTQQTQVRQHQERRQTAHEDDSRVPSWAIRGAQAARLEAEREEHARVPSWAIRGAEAAARETDHDAPARETFGSSWQSDTAWRFWR